MLTEKILKNRRVWKAIEATKVDNEYPRLPRVKSISDKLKEIESITISNTFKHDENTVN